MRRKIRKYWSVLLTDKGRFRFHGGDEYGWDEMERRLRQDHNSHGTLRKLGEALLVVWQNILRVFHGTLMAPVRCWCVAFVNASDGQTQYR